MLRTTATVTAIALSAGMLAASTPAAGAVTTGAAPSTSAPVVSRADIDGDRRADRTFVQKAGDTVRVTVRTAAGRTATTSVPAPYLYGDVAPFLGVTRLDGVKGNEIVVRTGLGAHTQYARVLTWRQGRLVTEKDPSGANEWITDGAMSAAMGYTLSTDGSRRLTQIVLGRDSFTTGNRVGTFSGRRIVAQWTNGRWTPITDRALVRQDGPGALAGAGWNVPGLPRW